MARKRMVDPKFFKDWELFEAERRSGLPLRLAYEGLWAVADREGRFTWKPMEHKLDVLPFDDVDFGAIMDALMVAGFVCRYEVDGKDYGCIPNFKRYQSIHPREAASSIPPPPSMPTQDTPNPGEGSPQAILGNGKDSPSPSASTSASASASASVPRSPKANLGLPKAGSAPEGATPDPELSGQALIEAKARFKSEIEQLQSQESEP